MDISALEQNLFRQAGIFKILPTPQNPALESCGVNPNGSTGRRGIPASSTFPVLAAHDSSISSPRDNGSPAKTPRQGPVSHVGAQRFSPEAIRSGRLTEPRNYAPRTSGQPITQEPPPRFDLPVVAYGSGARLVSHVQGRPPKRENLSSPGHSPRQLATPPAPSAAGSVIAYIPLPANAVPAPSQLVYPSDGLKILTCKPSGLVTLSVALDPANFPFMEASRQARASSSGVVKLKNVCRPRNTQCHGCDADNSQIPFATKRSEVIAFLGRNARILHDTEEPIHIIMDRVTSKTMDAYVEFTTLDEASKAVERHHNGIANGRTCRLGDRQVEVELSSQGGLMHDLFPLATGVIWNGGSPQFKPLNIEHPWENFKGFISEEEMTMLVKHVEVPHRVRATFFHSEGFFLPLTPIQSPFSKECPQRPYECLISTLKKFPWWLTDRTTISQRQAMFRATCELVRLLLRSIQRNDDPLNLTMQLCKRVVAASMRCPGFTPIMKDDIAFMVNMSEAEQRGFGQPPCASSWRHQYALAPKPGIPDDVVEVKPPAFPCPPVVSFGWARRMLTPIAAAVVYRPHSRHYTM